jgi:hypothetical protein
MHVEIDTGTGTKCAHLERFVLMIAADLLFFCFEERGRLLLGYAAGMYECIRTCIHVCMYIFRVSLCVCVYM